MPLPALRPTLTTPPTPITLTTLAALLADALAGVLDLVLPQACVGCQRPGAQLCGECLAEAGPSPFTVAAGAGLVVAAAARYAGPVAAAVVSHKEHGRHPLAAPLGRLLAGSVRHALTVAGSPPSRSGAVLLVPVPSSAAARRQRGEDPTARLARAAARELAARLPPSAGPVRVGALLRQVRRVADQARLGAEQRAENLRGAFEVRPAARERYRDQPPDLQVVVVDDIITTGSTMREAARAVRAAGLVPPGVPVPAAVVAATPARSGRTGGWGDMTARGRTR